MKKNILITGSTDGIGKRVASQFASEGHTIYLHGRNQAKLDDTITQIKQSSNNNEVYGFVADFSNMNDVRHMAAKINDKLSHIDLLINNAGIFKSPTAKTKDGYDIRIAVNYFAPYILTEALMPLIAKADHPRIINLSSAAQAPVSEFDLRGITNVSVNEAYAQSKLALTMWSFYLAQQTSHITVIAVNPGSLLNTKMANEAYGQYWSSADKGSNILHELALSEAHKHMTGKYYDNDNATYAKAHPHAYDANKVTQLIQTTKELLA